MSTTPESCCESAQLLLLLLLFATQHEAAARFTSTEEVRESSISNIIEIEETKLIPPIDELQIISRRSNLIIFGLPIWVDSWVKEYRLIFVVKKTIIFILNAYRRPVAPPCGKPPNYLHESPSRHLLSLSLAQVAGVACGRCSPNLLLLSPQHCTSMAGIVRREL